MPTRERLRDIITDHFNYEVKELVNCRFLALAEYPEQLRPAFINMNLEHTLLHCRVLFEFYYKLKERYPEHHYPRANMYLPDYVRPAFTLDIKDEDENFGEPGFWKKVNNQILHLGSERTSEPPEKFTIGEALNVANDLLKITRDFLSRLESVEDGYYFNSTLQLLSVMVEGAIVTERFQSSAASDSRI